MIVLRQTCAVAIALALTSTFATGQTRDLGILGKVAPDWSVSRWENLSEAEATLEISDFRGKVLYLFCFQSWCPGCHSHGFPTLKQVMEEFSEHPDVRFVAIQTVFEGFSVNSFESGLITTRKFGLNIPFGQSGESGQRSAVMTRYRTGGTPWAIIIDKSGVVRFNDFNADAQKAAVLINLLLDESSEESLYAMIPKPRAGADMVGRRLDLSKLQPVDPSGVTTFDLTGKVTLVRWWTDTCPYCAVSLPAVETLREQFPSDRFQTLAVYHPKPIRPMSRDDVLSIAHTLGYTGPVALDADWSALKENYLNRASRPATSVSFILDDQAIVRYVHPGPEFCAVDSPEKTIEHKDFLEIRKVIEMLLNESFGDEGDR